MSDSRTPMELIASLRQLQRAKWAAGERAPIEDLIAPHPDLRDDLEAMSDLVVNEIAVRRRHGETPVLAGFVARFPHMEQRLRQIFEVDAVMGTHPDPVRNVLPDIPGYVVLKELGRGGGGIVYQAREKQLSRPVAIKIAHANVSVDELRRFRNDAEAASRLKHPNIVSIYRVGVAGGSPFFTMEYADGGSLAGRITGRVLPPRLAAQLMEKIARGMQHAHQMGVVHRDLKPSNMILISPPQAWQGATITAPTPSRPSDPDATTASLPVPPPAAADANNWSSLQRYELKIADFGMARLLDDDSHLTRTGFAPGTVRYMSPEHASGNSRTIEARSDIFSLGVMLYEMLTGSVPFAGENDLETIGLIANQDPVAPRRILPSIPADLETICMKCLSKVLAQRYASAEMLAEDLRRYLHHEPIQAKRPSTVERVKKWCRRRPLLATLYGTIAVLLVMSLGLWIDRNAKEREANIAEVGRAREEGRRIRADRDKQVAEARNKLLAAESELAVTAKTLAEQKQRRAEAQPHLTRADVARHERFRQAEVVSLAEAIPKLDGAEATAIRVRMMEAVAHSIAPVATSSRRISLASVQYSPDGKFLVTGDLTDPFVRIWDMTTGRQTGVIDQHVAPADRGGPWATVRCLEFDPDHPERLITAGLDGTTCAWNLTTLARTTVVGIEPPETDAILSMAITPPQADGQRRLLTGHRGGRLVLRDLATLLPIRELAAHPKPVVALAVDVTGTHWATACQDGTVRIWGSDGRLQADLKPLAGAAPVGDAAPDELFTVAYSPDGTRLAASGNSGAVHVWNADSHELVRSIDAHQPGPGGRHSVQALAFLNDRQIVSGGSDGFVRIWEVSTGTAVQTCERHEPNGSGEQAVWSLAIHPERHQIASTGQDGTIRVWEAETGRSLLQLEGGQLPLDRDLAGVGLSAAHCPNHDVLVMSGMSMRSPLRTWDTKRLRPIREYTDLPTLAEDAAVDRITALAVAPNGERFVSSEPTGDLFLWDTKTGERLKSVQGHAVTNLVDKQQAGAFVPTGTISAMAWSPVGDRVASVGYDHRIKVWDAASLESLADWEDGDPETKPPAVTGTLEATQRQGQTVLSPDHDILFTNDSERLITSGRDEVIRVWSISKKEIEQRLRGHVAPISALATDPSGTRLASGATDGMVVIWDWATGRQLRVVQLEPLMVPLAFGTPVRLPERMRATGEKERLRLARAVQSVAFSPNGLWLAVALGDGTVSLVDLTTSQVAYRGAAHEQSPAGMSKVAVFFTSRGELISAANDQTVRRWDVPHDAAPVAELKDSNNNGGGPSIEMSPDGSEWLVPTNGGILSRWSASNNTLARSLKLEKDHVHSAVWLPDGKHILAGTILGQALILNADDQSIVRAYRGPDGTREPEQKFVAAIVAISADGRLAASSWLNGEVDLWNVADGAHVRSLTVPARLIRALAFHPRQPQLAIAEEGTNLFLWDYADNDPDRIPPAITGPRQATGLAYSPDGRRLVMAGQEHQSVSVAVIDPLTRSILRSLTGHQSVRISREETAVLVYGAAFSHNGRWLATCAADTTVRLWSVRIADDPQQDVFQTEAIISTGDIAELCGDTRKPGQAPRTVDLNQSNATTRQWLISVAFSRDDRRLATAANAGPIKVYDLASLLRESQRPADALQEHFRHATSLELTPQGLRVRQNLRLIPPSTE